MERSHLVGTLSMLAAVALVAGGLAYAGFVVFNFPLFACVLFALLVTALAYFIIRDRELSAALQAMDARFEAFSEFEADLNRRLAQKQDVVEAAQGSEARSDQARLLASIHDLENRLAALEGGSPIDVPVSPAPAGRSEMTASTTGIVAKGAALDGIDLKKALKDDALSIHLQPVVELASRRPVNYEAMIRLKMPAGDYLDASQFAKLAAKGGLQPALDRKCLHACIRMVERLSVVKKKAGLFANISSATLEDAAAFREVLRFLDANKQHASSLVIEISQRELRHLEPMARDRLGKLVDLGFRLSLDNVQDLRLDIPALHRQGFRAVKIPAGILLHATVDDQAPALPSEMSDALAEADIDLVATDVERESEALALIDYRIRYAQGLVFAPPRPVKRELIDAPSRHRAADHTDA